MKTVAVLQPGYLPWLGFFDQLFHADVFVYYDDVQFDKHGWRNRNRIKSPEGAYWLTVPVFHTGLGQPKINEIEIDSKQRWAPKHLGSIRQFYHRAPFFDRYFPELEEILNRPWKKLIDLNIAVTDKMCQWLGLRREIHFSSQLNIQGEQTERLVNICRHFSATRYLTGDSARDYLKVDLFSSNGILVKWQEYQHPVYPQIHGEFISHLSALDLIMNVGEKSLSVITKT